MQGAGAASILLATLWLGASIGPEGQGVFSRTKAELEFVTALAMFGLPQALFFYVKSGALDARAALRWALGSALLALPIGAAYGALQHSGSGAMPLLIGVAVALCVAQGQTRALLLVRERTVWFNAVTAAPQLLVLGGVGLLIDRSLPSAASTWLVVFAVAFGLVAAVASYRLVATLGGSAPSTMSLHALANYGSAIWLTGALTTAAILAMQHRVEAAAGAASLGQFTMAMTLSQVPLTPISYAAPLLLRRWMEQSGAGASKRWGWRLFLALLTLAAAAGVASLRWPDLGLGPAYAGVTLALAILLAGGAAEATSRILTVQASATGLPWVAVRAEVARWVVLVVGVLSPLPVGLWPLCVVWSLAAVAAAAVFVGHAMSTGARTASVVGPG